MGESPGHFRRGKTIQPFHVIPSSNLNEWKVALLVRVDWENVVIQAMRDTGQTT